MGFSSYYSVVKHLERSGSQDGSLSSFYVQGHGQVLGSCFSVRKPMKKGKVGTLKPWDDLTWLCGLGSSWSLRATPSLSHRAWDIGPQLPGSALFCLLLCSSYS